jgi:hypothetical protein
MRIRSIVTVALLSTIAACGGVDAGDTTSAPSTTSPSTTTTTTTTTAPTTAPETTTTSPVSAVDSLIEFTGAATDLDQAIADAAALFNESWDATGTVDAIASDAIAALDTAPLRDLIPPGLEPDLELAVLAVFTDLDSRISALHGAVRFESVPEDVLLCLGLGATSFRRYDADFMRVLELAEASTAPTAAPDSEAAGVLAARLETIHSLNWGCDSCGGFEYDEAIPVNWEAQTVFDEVGFESEFADGRWEIRLYAC